MLAAVAAHGLSGAPALAASPLAPAEWRQLLHGVSGERIEGLLGAAIAAGDLPVTDEQLDEARQAIRGRASVDLFLERELLLTAGHLDAAGVTYRVLKGPAWAHTVYPDPSWRGFGDVDLLIPAADWYRAIRTLEGSGARRQLPELRVDFDARFGKDATLCSVRGWEIDLHRALVLGPYGLWVDHAELFAQSAAAIVGGRQLPVLDPDVAFLHACYNAALADDPPRLIALRDVGQMVLSVRLDPVRVQELASQWKGTAVVARALALASRILGVPLADHPVAEPFSRRRAGLWDRSLLASYRGPGRGYTSQATSVVALDGWGDRLAYLRALVRPQPSYLAARGISPATHIRRGLRRLWTDR